MLLTARKFIYFLVTCSADFASPNHNFSRDKQHFAYHNSHKYMNSNMSKPNIDFCCEMYERIRKTNTWVYITTTVVDIEEGIDLL